MYRVENDLVPAHVKICLQSVVLFMHTTLGRRMSVITLQLK